MIAVNINSCHWHLILLSNEKNYISVIQSNATLHWFVKNCPLAECWGIRLSLWHTPSRSVLSFISGWLQKLMSICTAYFTCASLGLGNLFTCRLFTEKCTCGLVLYLNRSWIYYLTLYDLQIGGKIHKIVMTVLSFYPWPSCQAICILLACLLNICLNIF